MDAKLVSIIVPVYNAEKYLGKCVESLINQTYKNLEIILLDDGSTDNSPLLCDEYAKKDNRIKVIHKGNSGVSDTRNKGLEVANGEYIGFVDSDDWLEPDTYEFLLNNAIKYSADISACGAMYKKDDLSFFKIDEECWNTPTLFEGKNKLDFILDSYYTSYVIWNKLYRAEIVKNVKMDTSMKIAEDSLFLYNCVKDCKKLVVENSPKYYYRYSSSSAIHTLGDRDNDRFMYIDAIYKDEMETKEKLPKFANFYLRYLVNNGKGVIADSLIAKKKRTEINKQLKLYANKLRKTPLCFYKHVSIATKLKAILIVFMPYIYMLIVKNQLVKAKKGKI